MSATSDRFSEAPHASRSVANPFIEDVFQPGQSELPGVAEIHTRAMSQCVSVLESLVRNGENGLSWGKSGRTILIAAPRAGYGKTHLIARLRSVTESLVAVINLPFDPSRAIGWETVWHGTWRQYENTRCHRYENCTLLDEVGRYFCATLTTRALGAGVFSARDLPESVEAIERHFHDVFDPEAADTRKMPTFFAKRQSEITQATGAELAARWGMRERDVAWWAEVFKLRGLGKASAAEEQIFSARSPEAKERLGQFLRIGGDLRPTAFIADHLDGFFGSENAGMRIAEILTGLRTLAPRSVTLLCLNEDVWDSVFDGRIPSAWMDRLAGEPASLRGITADSAEALVRGRLLASGVDTRSTYDFLERLRETESWDHAASRNQLYPREVIRAARSLWDQHPAEAASSDDPLGATLPHIPTPAQSISRAPQVEEGEPITVEENAVPPRKMDSAAIASAARALADSAKEKMAGFRTERPTDPSSRPATRAEVAAVDPENFPMAAEAPKSFFDSSDRDFTNQAAAAAAAGKGLTDIDSIVAEIRGGGSRALSEMPSDSPSREIETNETTNELTESATPVDNPFWANNPDQRLQDLENEELKRGEMQWDPARVAWLVREIGENYTSVAQEVLPLEGSNGAGFLKWTVKGYQVLLGFESPRRPGYWDRLLKVAAGERWVTKVAVLSHHSDPFDFKTFGSIDSDRAVAMRYFDVVELTDGDLALLYASERFLKEHKASGDFEDGLKVVSRRLDPFWSRLTRALPPVAA